MSTTLFARTWCVICSQADAWGREREERVNFLRSLDTPPATCLKAVLQCNGSSTFRANKVQLRIPSQHVELALAFRERQCVVPIRASKLGRCVCLQDTHQICTLCPNCLESVTMVRALLKTLEVCTLAWYTLCVCDRGSE